MMMLSHRTSHMAPHATTHGQHKHRIGVWLLAFVLLAGISGRADMTAPSLEYPVKAACLYWFANYVAWPKEAFAETSAPLVIAVLGKDPFGTVLESNLQGKTVQNRPIQLKRVERVADLNACHILFISASEKNTMPEILTALKGRGILTVSEVPGFLEQGGMINFVRDSSNVRFEVNLMASKPERLEVDARLLREARLVILTSGERREKNN